ncbi:MAG: CoA pyrophosphatase [Thermoproteota archaeon]|nr:CoA pyrophosphatase [Thermoproteota archaeon]
MSRAYICFNRFKDILRKEEILSFLRPAMISRPYLPTDAVLTRPAAVLVIIHYHKDRPHVFLTKRSANLKLHSGEISFPGGRYVESDGTFLATALRETAEEVGIIFSTDQILGCLTAVRTMTSNHFIVPFVTIQDILPQYRISTDEVEAVIDVPLIETLKSIELDTEHYHIAKDAFKFTFDNNVIWGATARVLKQMYDLLIRPL